MRWNARRSASAAVSAIGPGLLVGTWPLWFDSRGPGLGGLMLSLGWPAREIVLSACLPVLVAIVILALLSRRG